MSLSELNYKVMVEAPVMLVELMVLMPSMVENCFSKVSATEAAIVSGLAPGKLAVTLMTGVLKAGNAEIGILLYANTPAKTADKLSNTVMTGR